MPIFNQIVNLVESRLNRRKKNLAWLSFSYTFRQIAGNLSVFYLPLFFFQVAQEMNFGRFELTSIQRGLVMISVFYLLERLVAAILSMLQASFSIKVGHDWSMAMGTIFYALFLLSLSYLENNPWLVLLSGFLAGVQLVFYWPSYNTLVARFSFKKHMGKSLGGLGFLQNFTSMITPALGGLIIVFLGYNVLFFSGIFLLMISLIGIFKLELSNERDEVNINEYLEWMREKSFMRLAVSQSGKYFYDMSIVLWPLYVYLLLGDVEKVGYVYSFSIFLAMLVSLLGGLILDKKRKNKKPFYFSGGFLSTLSLVRVLVFNVWGVVIVDSFTRVVGNFHWLFNDRIIFNRSKGSQDFSFFVYNGFNRSVAATVYWFLLLVFFFLVPIEWTGLFVLGSVGVLLSLFVQESKDDD
ncbi:MAG: Transporter, major facilitator superfamily [Microgenomates bacterium 39_7]|nr:MAG: Transporter, major facilitator superfamily [Microgenomates bacterium 39_7]